MNAVISLLLSMCLGAGVGIPAISAAVKFFSEQGQSAELAVFDASPLGMLARQQGVSADVFLPTAAQRAEQQREARQAAIQSTADFRRSLGF